jgi:GTP-sensing pleiotropic transcriptional regulator CodY
MVVVKVDNTVAELFTVSAAIVNEAGVCIGFFVPPGEFRDRLFKSMAYEWEHETREEAMADIAMNGTLSSDEGTAILEKALAARKTYTFEQ